MVLMIREPQLRSLFRLGGVVRCLLIALACLTQWTRIDWWWGSRHASGDAVSEVANYFTHYDASAQLLVMDAMDEQYRCRGVTLITIVEFFQWMVHWDGMHFMEVARTGDWGSLEKEAAFAPGLPFIIRGCGKMIQTVVPSLCPYATLLLATFILSQLCFFLNIYLLYALTMRIFRSTHFAYLSTICFIFSPASIFMMTCYTESVFLVFALSGMLARERGRCFLSAFLFACSTLIRSNGYVFIGFFIFDSIRRTWIAPRGISLKTFWIWFRMVIHASIVVAPYLALQFYLARRFCTPDIIPPSSSLPPYCQSIIPNVYSHIQSKYWNVGLFRYYEMKQIPNFLFAAPIWTFSFYGIITYARANPTRFLSIGLWNTLITTMTASSTTQATADAPATLTIFTSSHSLVYMYLWSGLMVICVTILHVQVSTRFLSSCPPVYWFAAHLLMPSTMKTATASPPNPHQSVFTPSRLLPIWSGAFMIVGTILFSAFLPWT